MFDLFRKKKKPVQPLSYPQDSDHLDAGVYNLWKSSYLGREDNGGKRYSAMSDTIEYFVLTPIDDSRTHVVRVMKDVDDNSQFRANYSEDSKVFSRSDLEITALDVMNAYPRSEHLKQWSKPEDHFGLQRVGTLGEFVERMKYRY